MTGSRANLMTRPALRPLPWPVPPSASTRAAPESAPTRAAPAAPTGPAAMGTAVRARDRVVDGRTPAGLSAAARDLIEGIDGAVEQALVRYEAARPSPAELRSALLSKSFSEVRAWLETGVELDPLDLQIPFPHWTMAEAFDGGRMRGNPFRAGTPSWETFGRRTGVWVSAVDWPSRLEGDLTGIEYKLRDEVLHPGFQRALVELADGLAQVSELISSAAAAGATSSQLRELHEEWSQLDDLGAGSNAGDDFMTDGPKRFLNGETEWGLGTIVELLRNGTRTQHFADQTEGDGMAMQIGAATGRTLDRLRDALQRMDLDVHNVEAEQKERVSRRLILHLQKIGPQLVALRRAGREDEADHVREYLRERVRREGA